MQKADLLTSAPEEGSNDGCTRESHSRRGGTWSKSQSRVNTFKNQFPLQNRNTSVANAGSWAVREVKYAYAFAYVNVVYPAAAAGHTSSRERAHEEHQAKGPSRMYSTCKYRVHMQRGSWRLHLSLNSESMPQHDDHRPPSLHVDVTSVSSPDPSHITYP